MNREKISKALTDGLVSGYGGKTEFRKSTRGSFEISSSHFEKDGIVYHDEWTNGGGQEIIDVDGESFTRVYAGCVADEKILNNLKITHRDVIQNLVSRIKELGDKTRLFNNCSVEEINDWKYSYQVLDNDNEIGVTVGKEIIKYQDKTVFVHCFVLSPIKK
jgi:hypothetical protein